jgi:hypothetical protein
MRDPFCKGKGPTLRMNLADGAHSIHAVLFIHLSCAGHVYVALTASR